jgi:hypothetical protein
LVIMADGVHRFERDCDLQRRPTAHLAAPSSRTCWIDETVGLGPDDIASQTDCRSCGSLCYYRAGSPQLF